MDYREKHSAAQRLQSNQYIEQDRALLRKYQPHSHLMSRSIAMRNGESLSFEILYVLLDYASPAEIVQNRQKTDISEDYHARMGTILIPDKKKGLPSMRSFQELSGKISRILSFKKQN